MAQYLDLEGTKILANKIKENKNNKLDKTGGTVTGKTLFNQGIGVKNINAGGGTSGYMHIAQIKIGSTNRDQPIIFNIQQRGRYGAIIVKFPNASSVDPTLQYINKVGNINAYIYKSATSTWDLYVQKSEAYDSIDIIDFNKGEYMSNVTVTWQNATVTSLPSGYVTATNASIDMNTSTASKLQTARGITIGNTKKPFDGSADVSWNLSEIGAYTKSEIDTKLNGKANSSHTHDDRYYTETEINDKLNGKANSSHTHTKSQITDMPTSLKNPTALTVQFNGTTNKTYDGSSAQTVNITPSAIGASASNHTHNYAGSSSAGGSANSAVKLATAKTINGVAFDGTSNITIADSTKVPNSSNSSITIQADSDASSTTEYMSLKAGGNELKITSSGGGTSPAKNVNNLTYNGNLVYHAGRKPTPAEIGASASSHTHNYAGSSSAGGSANSAVKLATARGITIGNTKKTFDGSADVSWNLSEIGAYTKSEIDTKFKSLDNNLLANGDFKAWNVGNLISFSSAEETNIADGWKYSNYGTSGSYKGNVEQVSTSGGVKMTSVNSANAQNMILLQEFVEGRFKNLQGKQVTITANYTNYTGTGLTIGFKINGSFNSSYNKIFSSATASSTISYTVTLPNTITQLAPFILINATNGKSITVNHMKLELGATATPFVSKPYLEDLILANNGTLTGNPNLLINGNFKNPVNQRGQTEYTINTQYTIDRWKLINWNDTANRSEGKMVVHADCIELTGAGKDQLYIQQPMEMEKWHIGKTMTLSCDIKLTDATQGSIFIQVVDYNVSTINKKIYSFSEISSEKFTRISTTFNVPTTLRNGLAVEIGVYHTYGNGMINSQARLYLNNVKLELGSVATPFVPRIFDEELALCRRYFERVASSHGFGVGFCVNADTVRVITRYLPKRVRPTLTSSVATTFSIESSSQFSVSVARVEPLDIDEFGNGYVNVACHGGLTLGHGARLKRSDNGFAYIDYDAEIY